MIRNFELCTQVLNSVTPGTGFFCCLFVSVLERESDGERMGHSGRQDCIRSDWIFFILFHASIHSLSFSIFWEKKMKSNPILLSLSVLRLFYAHAPCLSWLIMFSMVWWIFIDIIYLVTDTPFVYAFIYQVDTTSKFVYAFLTVPIFYK